MSGSVGDNLAADFGDVTTWPPRLRAAVDGAVDDWEDGGKVGRLWAGDSTLWTGADEHRWLGWLGVLDDPEGAGELEGVSPAALGGVFDDALVLGMGGSSLCPEVLGLSFGPLPGAPRLHVLDSTDPSQIRSCAARLSLDRTVFIVSSKSGTTLESSILMRYFLDRVAAVAPPGTAGERFVAVTDPGSELERFADEHEFRNVFHGVPSIGGRYSALSHFGMVPASIMGIEVGQIMDRAREMKARCTTAVPVAENPGAMLGLALGTAAQEGRDKVTFVASPGLRSLGTWVEQLLAESTGKGGQGVIPIDGEALSAPDTYGDDRVFVYVRDERDPDLTQDEALSRLSQAGLPVLRIPVRDRYDLGAEFFRWEFATAVAGALLQVTPFDQADVEASKVATRQLTTAYERTGQLPEESPLCVDRDLGLSIFADDRNAAALRALSALSALSMDEADRGDLVGDVIAAHCGRIGEGDYFAVLAYLEMSDAHQAALQELRHVIRDATGRATCLQFGPRFLHSTGQAYKGGPNSGVFLQVTCDDPDDLDVPGQGYTFGVVKAAQARADLAVLGERHRRAIRVHLSGDVQTGLERLATVVNQSVGRPA
jgi:transaldolase/glucose-6-phosphate isomerase